MRRIKEWFNRKAKKFVNKHVVIPVNMSLIESHHETLRDIQQEIRRLNESVNNQWVQTKDLYRVLMGYVEEDRTGAKYTVKGVIDTLRDQRKEIDQLRAQLDQLSGLAKILPKFDELASKNELVSVSSEVKKVEKTLMGEISNVKYVTNEMEKAVRETILKEGSGDDDK